MVPAKGLSHIHHGAIDQMTIMMYALLEVMKHVHEVLEAVGIDIWVESNYKYHCIHSKRRKSVGLGLRDAFRNGGSLVVIAIMGSVASNGIDKHGLPVPSLSFYAGCMLRGLLIQLWNEFSAFTPS